MTNSEREFGDLFWGMMKSGLVSTSNRWIEIATEQKNPRLTLDLAYSFLLVYDRLDKKLANLVNN